MKRSKKIFAIITIIFCMILAVPVSAATVKTLKKGDTYNINVSGDYIKTAVSSNTNVLKITKLTKTSVASQARNYGNATITVTTKKNSQYKYHVSVKGLSASAVKVEAGKTVTVDAINISKPVWKSSNNSIATVSSKGVIKGVKPGSATVTCVSGRDTFKCIVTVYSDTTDVDKMLSKANKCVRDAFKMLGGKIKYNSKTPYAGKFSARDMTITLRKKDLCVYHELGHFLSWMGSLKQPDLKKEIQKVYSAEKNKYIGYNKVYVCQNSDEYMAESYRDYCLNKSTLKRQRPKTYNTITKLIKNVSGNAKWWKKMTKR